MTPEEARQLEARVWELMAQDPVACRYLLGHIVGRVVGEAESGNEQATAAHAVAAAVEAATFTMQMRGGRIVPMRMVVQSLLTRRKHREPFRR